MATVVMLQPKARRAAPFVTEVALQTQRTFTIHARAPRSRSAVLWEFLELLRDFLGWLALLLLAVTLVRLPKVRVRIGELCELLL